MVPYTTLVCTSQIMTQSEVEDTSMKLDEQVCVNISSTTATVAPNHGYICVCALGTFSVKTPTPWILTLLMPMGYLL